MELTLMLLTLAAGAQALPQAATDSALHQRDFPIIKEDGDVSLQTVHVAGKRDFPKIPESNEDMSMGTIHVPMKKRDFPKIPESDDEMSMGTIHVPMKKRDFPKIAESSDEMSMGTIHVPMARRSGPGFVSLPVIHKEQPSLAKRAFEMDLENRTDIAYYAQLQMGTPPQEVFAQVDTGSYELWVDPDCSMLLGSTRQFCEAVGQYEVKNSSTAKSLDKKTSINYGLGGAEIAYYTDNVGLADDITLKGMRFGVATKSQDQHTGVLGLGKGDGAYVDYKNFIDELKDQGITKTRAFSVGLGAKADGNGVIAFGGVDTKKFSGSLAKLPIVSPSPDNVPRYWVSMKSIVHKGSDGKSSTVDGSEIPVFLDTGATLTLLPPALVSSIAAKYGSPKSDSSGFYMVDCKLAEGDGSLDFEFEGVTISVANKEIIRQTSANPPRCYLGITPSEKFSLLGDTVMRSMYAVFDTEADNIYLAQYHNCGSDIKTINKSSDIDGMKGSCGSGDKPKDEPKSTSSGTSSKTTSAVSSKTTAAPKTSVTTVITTSSGSSAVTITTVTDATPTSTPSSGGDDKSEGDKPDSEGSDDKTSGQGDNNGSSSKEDNKESENNAENNGLGGDGGSAAGKVAPLSVLASAVVGMAVLFML